VYSTYLLTYILVAAINWVRSHKYWLVKITPLVIVLYCWHLKKNYMPRPRRGGGIINYPRLSVRPTVCGVHRHNWRTETRRKPKFDRMEAHHTGNKWTYLEVKRSKVKVTRPSNAHAVNVQYLPNGKAYELKIWYSDATRRPASATSAVTFKVKDHGRKVT